jgi:hypothetical protein
MTTLFEKYELQRKRYSPGMYWRTENFNVIKELVIVPIPKVKVRNFMSLYCSPNWSDNVMVMVTISIEPPDLNLGPGNYIYWSKEYMEYNYKPGNYTDTYSGNLYRYEPV